MPDTRLKPETAYGHLEASLPFAPGNTFNIDKVCTTGLNFVKTVKADVNSEIGEPTQITRIRLQGRCSCLQECCTRHRYFFFVLGAFDAT